MGVGITRCLRQRVVRDEVSRSQITQNTLRQPRSLDFVLLALRSLKSLRQESRLLFLNDFFFSCCGKRIVGVGGKDRNKADHLGTLCRSLGLDWCQECIHSGGRRGAKECTYGLFGRGEGRKGRNQELLFDLSR